MASPEAGDEDGDADLSFFTVFIPLRENIVLEMQIFS